MKRGRPARPDEQNRPEFLPIRQSRAEREALDRARGTETRSSFARRAINRATGYET